MSIEDPPDPDFDPASLDNSVSWPQMRAWLVEHDHLDMVSQLDDYQRRGHEYMAVNPRTNRRQSYVRPVADSELVRDARKALQTIGELRAALVEFEQENGVTVRFEDPQSGPSL